MNKHQGEIASVAVSDQYIQGELKAPLPGSRKGFITTRVPPDIAGELQK